MKLLYTASLMLCMFIVNAQSNIQLLDNIDIGLGNDYAYSVLAYDYDEDGDEDIIVALNESNVQPFQTTYNCKIAWYENLGTTFGPKQTIRFLGVQFPLSMEFVDMDNDQDVDIVGPYYQNSFIPNRGFLYHEQTGTNNFDQTVNLAYGTAQIPTNLKIVTTDFDYDGDIDYITHYNSGGLGNGTTTVQLYKNDGAGNFSTSIIFVSNALQSTKQFTIADIDGDQFTDYISYNDSNNKVIYYKNDGLGNVGFAIETDINVTDASELFCFDMNDDGLNDIVHTISGQINWYENLGNDQFSAAQLVSNKSTVAFKITDVDFDGDNDIVAFHSDNDIIWYNNDGAGSFSSALIANTGSLPSQNTFVGVRNIIEVADFDGDGLKDVVMNRKDGNENLNYYLNTNQPTNTIKGTVYLDANNNQVLDAGENGISNAKVLIQPGNTYVYTNNFGAYSFEGSSGSTYTIELQDLNNYTPTTAITNSIQLPIDPSNTYDFGLMPTGSFLAGKFNVSSGAAICGQKSLFSIAYLNEGSDVSNVLIDITSPFTTFVSAYSITPSIISPNYLRFALNGINPMQTKQITLTVDMPSQFDGDTLEFVCQAIRLNSAGAPVDTIEYLYKPVLSCTDVDQDKMVNPVGDGLDHEVESDTRFSYTISFQNNGTDTIENVSISDVIDDALDLETLQILNSSDIVQVDLQNTTRTLNFQFEDINLMPSSINEVESQGFVTFSIEPIANLDGDVLVENFAMVQFENDPAQSTNTVFNTLVNDVATFTIQNQLDKYSIDVFPNPITESATVVLNELLKETAFSLHLVDVKGALVRKYDISQATTITLHKNELNNGIYFLQVYDKKGQSLGNVFQIAIQ